jgi:hypothetical protein
VTAKIKIKIGNVAKEMKNYTNRYGCESDRSSYEGEADKKLKRQYYTTAEK